MRRTQAALVAVVLAGIASPAAAQTAPASPASRPATSRPAASAPAAGARAGPVASHTLSLRESGAVATVLRRSAPSTRFEIALPHRWTSASMRMDLAWEGSDMLAPGSSIAVDVDGVPFAAAAVEAGPGRLSAIVPVSAVPTHRFTVEIHAAMNVAAGVSARAAARGVFVRLDPLSTVRISGSGHPAPLLSDLPGSLIERIGDRVPPLVIALPADPSESAVHAAAIVAGAVSVLTGFPGTTVRTLSAPSDAALLRVPGAVVRIADRPGEATLTVAQRPSGTTQLTIGGANESLVDAAWAAAYGATLLDGNHAAVSGAETRIPVPRPIRDLIPIGPAASEGSDAMTIVLPFRVSVARIVDAARIKLRIAYDMPPGGRIAIRANNRPIVSRVVRSSGDGRLTVDVVLEQGAVRPGDNSIEIMVQPGRASATETSAPSARVEVLSGSALTVRSHARHEAALNWWPFLSRGDRRWANTIVSIPSDPTPAEVDAVIATLAEAVRWAGAPLRYTVTFDAPAAAMLARSNLVMLVRDPREADGLVPAGAAQGTLAVARRGEHAALIAVGSRALKPLSSGYFAGSVKGGAIVVDARGGLHRIAPAVREPAQGRELWWPVSIGTLVASLLLAAGFMRAKRRFSPDENDEPWSGVTVGEAAAVETATHVPGRVDSVPLDRDRALDEWIRIREERAL